MLDDMHCCLSTRSPESRVQLIVIMMVIPHTRVLGLARCFQPARAVSVIGRSSRPEKGVQKEAFRVATALGRLLAASILRLLEQRLACWW